MIAEARSFTFLANEGPVKVPYFQRPYVWNEDNWEDMLSYLLEPGMNHFIGSIILKQTEAQSGRTKQAMVVDGQQRLTTISILLCALNNSIDEGREDLVKEVEVFNACMFYKKDMFDTNAHVKIEHSKADRQHFQAVIQNEINLDEIDYEKCESNILLCYKYFTDRLGPGTPPTSRGKSERRTSLENRISIGDQKKLFCNLLNPVKKIMVIIDLNSTDSEQRIYDTLNGMGARLTGADTIKHQLFQKALDLGIDSQEVAQLYKDTWESVFACDDKAQAFWTTVQSGEHFGRDNMELLLKDIAVVKGFFKAKSKNRDILNIYWKYINALDERSIKEFTRDIAAYASIYREKIIPTNYNDAFSFNDYSRRLQHILNVFDIRAFTPYILYLYHKYADDERTLKTELLRLETMVMRKYICNLQKNADNFRLCIDLIHDDNGMFKLMGETPTNEDFKTSLRSIKASSSNNKTSKADPYSKPAILTLFWLELYRRNTRYGPDKRFDSDLLRYDYSLEHIMPIDWTSNWGDDTIPILDDDGIAIEADKKYDYRNEHIHSIGNLTLLKRPLNKEVSNYNFNAKAYRMRPFANLGITRLDILEPYFSQKNDSEDKWTWDERQIRKRADLMIEDILKIWPRD